MRNYTSENNLPHCEKGRRETTCLPPLVGQFDHNFSGRKEDGRDLKSVRSDSSLNSVQD